MITIGGAKVFERPITSKAALDNMTKSLARALAPRIRVVSVAPALVDTEFVKSLDQAWHDEQAARSPLGRLAKPEEVAAAVSAVKFWLQAMIFMPNARPILATSPPTFPRPNTPRTLPSSSWPIEVCQPPARIELLSPTR